MVTLTPTCCRCLMAEYKEMRLLDSVDFPQFYQVNYEVFCITIFILMEEPHWLFQYY